MSSVKWKNVPLPEAHLAALGVGLALHPALPLRLPLGTRWKRVFGPLVVLLGMLLIFWGVVAVRDVDVDAPTRIVTRGPYALSRNPMYVGWTTVYLGITLMTGSRWLLILAPPMLASTHRTVLQEEHRLERRFGCVYDRYRRHAHRYL